MMSEGEMLGCCLNVPSTVNKKPKNGSLSNRGMHTHTHTEFCPTMTYTDKCTIHFVHTVFKTLLIATLCSLFLTKGKNYFFPLRE